MNIFQKLINKKQEETIMEEAENGFIYAPMEGEVIPLKEINDGVFSEEMLGKGFNPLVKVGEKIKCGQLLMTFSISDIEKAGYVTTTAIIVTNSDQYTDIEVLAQDHRKKSEKLIKIL